jgi:hypothetical protein
MNSSDIKHPRAVTTFAKLAAVNSVVSAVLGAFYGCHWSASWWGSVAGATVCIIVAIIAPALEAGAALVTFAGIGRAVFALCALWPLALAAEATVAWFDFCAIAARGDEVRSAREHLLKSERDRAEDTDGLRRVLTMDSTGLLAAQKTATAAEIRRNDECVVRASKCQVAERALANANGRVLDEANKQDEARKRAREEIRSLQAEAKAAPPAGVVNPLESELQPLLGDWARELSRLQQFWAAALISLSRLAFIITAAMLARPKKARAIFEALPAHGATRAHAQVAPAVAGAEDGTAIDVVSFLVPEKGAEVAIEEVRDVLLSALACVVQGFAKRHDARLADGGRRLVGLRLVKLRVDREAER